MRSVVGEVFKITSNGTLPWTVVFGPEAAIGLPAASSHEKFRFALDGVATSAVELRGEVGVSGNT